MKAGGERGKGGFVDVCPDEGCVMQWVMRAVHTTQTQVWKPAHVRRGNFAEETETGKES